MSSDAHRAGPVRLVRAFSGGSPCRWRVWGLQWKHRASGPIQKDIAAPPCKDTNSNAETAELYGCALSLRAFEWRDGREGCYALVRREKEIVKKELESAQGGIFVTVGNWRSELWRDTYECLCICFHWADKDWKLQRRVVRFKVLMPCYDHLTPVAGVTVEEEVVSCLAHWSVRGKMLSSIAESGLKLIEPIFFKLRDAILKIRSRRSRKKELL
ncbi:hypothetical protein CRG98_007850 [Punica granatum]|uniref:Uncharacterized protein n=1 Tax=Punica granatum TaxID=22663 RepID=A0A2I0KTB4_PUNGR|nr:hypothetical protein CRG98_007850 [Punica granatum]